MAVGGAVDVDMLPFEGLGRLASGEVAGEGAGCGGLGGGGVGGI